MRKRNILGQKLFRLLTGVPRRKRISLREARKYKGVCRFELDFGRKGRTAREQE